MELTRRQEDFVRNMLDLYREIQGPIHYSELAEKLGVSRFTAYDMLRLLEEKGIVSSDYRLDSGKSGPGRAEVVFTPTDLAHQMFTRLAGEASFGDDWEEIRESILMKIRSGEMLDQGIIDPQLATDVLSLVPMEGSDTLRYCVEVLSVIMMRLRRGTGRKLLLNYMPVIIPKVDVNNWEDLSLIGGFALGILVRENIDDHEWCLELIEHVKHYQSLVQEMSPRLRGMLANTLEDLYVSFERA